MFPIVLDLFIGWLPFLRSSTLAAWLVASPKVVPLEDEGSFSSLAWLRMLKVADLGIFVMLS